MKGICFFVFLFLLASISKNKLIRRVEKDVHQTCRRTLQLQRLDVFEGDAVQLVCTCQSQSQNQNLAGRSVVTDSSDFLDVSIWSFARNLKIPFRLNDFTFSINKVQKIFFLSKVNNFVVIPQKPLVVKIE